MKTANDFAKFAANLRQLAQVMKPAEDDPNAQTRKLIQFHLNSAAAKSQEIAEHLAAREPRPAA